MEHQRFIDWLKAVGMLLIVVGHIYGDPLHIFNAISQPIYTKQLGVCFFVFVTGWSLANDRKPGLQVVFNRLFPVYFYGILGALIVSVIFQYTKGDINESNYLPFILGVNVLFNYFPANTTTWYIGLYFHLLLFWYFFLQGRTINKKHMLIAFISENALRCLFISVDKDFTAYMLISNWISVFLLGAYLRNQGDTPWSRRTTYYCIGWIAALLFWTSAFNPFTFLNEGFPFREAPELALPVRSLLVSLIYLGSTYLAFQIFRSLPSFRLTSFFARNTLIIFIAHIPLLFETHRAFYALFPEGWPVRAIYTPLVFIGLAVFSEIVQKSINLKAISAQVWQIGERLFPTLKMSKDRG